jgi:membrane-associated phospholipid phosphatase
MSTIAWTFITALGDFAVLLPCIAIMVSWLFWSTSTRLLAWRWLSVLTLVGTAVVISKLAFMAWGIGIPALDFTGLSGHSAMAATVWPAVLSLLVSQWGRTWRLSGAATGFALALAIAISRVVLHAHSMSEVLLGLMLGAGVTLNFLRHHGASWRLQGSVYPAALLLLLILPWVYGHRFPSEQILKFLAQHLNIENAVYTRRYFKGLHD